MTTQNIEVSVKNYELPPITHGICGDTGRDLAIYVKDYALTASMTAKVLAYNADGTEYEISGTISTGTNTVTASMTNMLRAAGTTKCNLKVTLSGNDVQSFRFDVISHESAGGVPGAIQIVPLTATQDGTYQEAGKAYSPVTVETGGGGSMPELGTLFVHLQDYNWDWAELKYQYPVPTLSENWTWRDYVESDLNPTLASADEPSIKVFKIVGDYVYISFGGLLGDYEALSTTFYFDGETCMAETIIHPWYIYVMFSPDCMVNDTMISAKKSDIVVEDIQKGDAVETLDPETLLIKEATVGKVKRDIINPKYRFSDGWWKYTFDDGNAIRLAGTGKHRFFDCDTMKFEWMYDFQVGHHAYRKDGTTPKLVKVEHFDERIVYNTFWNENHENYFADGFLSGNADTPIPNFTFDFTEEK